MQWLRPKWWDPAGDLSSTLQKDDHFDIKEWGQWLRTHSIDNHDVYRIDFNDDQTRMMVWRYRRNRRGHKYLSMRTGEIARRLPKHYRVKTPPPSWIKRV